MPGLTRRLWGALRGAVAPARPTPARHDPDAPRHDRPTSAPSATYPGDFQGPLTLAYAPHPDDVPDPGEVVWTWVPFEEDYSRGKDRPVLIVGRESATWLLGLMLSSKDHDLDAAQEAAEHRYWVEIGAGPWDNSGRPSAVRVNRVIRVDASAVRRIGGRLDEQRFDLVAAEVRRHAGA